MNIGLILSRLIEDRNVRKTQLAKYLDVARNTLDDYLSERTYMTTEKLEKAAKFFNVPIGYFFEETSLGGNITQKGKGNFIANSQQVTISDCESKLEIAQNKIESLEALLEEKERTIQILMNKNNN
jgi:transcriptional regulator with XRE-family HTH domain